MLGPGIGTRACDQHPLSDGRAISWKRGQSLLFLNTVPGSQDPRYSVEMTGTSSTLTVTLVRREDAGQLTCQVASKPPIEQSFSIEIKGGSSKQDQVPTTFIYLIIINTQYSLRFITSHINDKGIPGLHSFVSLKDTLLAGQVGERLSI